MKILLMNQFFWPDSAATSQLLTDLARELTAQGHRVDVICGGTYATTDQGNAPAVSIHRVKGLPFSRGNVGRILSYLSFYLGAAWRALTMPQPDVVLTLTTPPLLSLIGAVVHRIRGARFYIWEMDMYPDVAVDLGYIRSGSLLQKLTGGLADWSRRQADGIVALGECMRTRLIARAVEPAKITVVHNWADSTQIRVLPGRLTESTLHLVYSGNLGLAHDVNTITAAMLQLRDDSRFSFTFIGGGSRRVELADFVAGNSIHSVSMRPYVPRADLSETLGLGDIGLVTQRDDTCGSVVPSKVYGLMAAGRPILFIGPSAATPAHIIETHACGWRVACGDPDSLVQLLRHLAIHPEEVTLAGINARHALETNYDLSLGTKRMISVLTGKTGFPPTFSSPADLAGDPVTPMRS
jgi:colanic acid biosynthesis glycosyl transferase WcaI